MSVLRVACVQLNTRDDVAANVAAATALIDEAADAGARLVVLPETWAFKGASGGIRESAEPLEGSSNAALGARAAKHGVWVLAGSHYETSPDPARVYNTSVLFGPDGDVRAVYRKIHLFDAVSRGMVYRESDDLLPGEALVTAEVDGVTVGLTICYDLRFPELYRALALQGAEVLLVPAAFTAYTGAAHWEILLRARAIENTCFVVAPDQVGAHLPGRECYGHSMIVDPWGLKLAELEDGVGFCVADLDLARLEEVRAQIPSLAAQRRDVTG
jgi:predicted amidohydrolase